MLEKLSSIFKQGHAQPAFDPKTIGDPLAEQTGWEPARGGGSNFRTHKLAIDHSGRVEFLATWGLKLFSAAFFLLGIGVTIGFATGMGSGTVSGQEVGGLEALFPIAIGLIFTGVGPGIYYFMAAPIVFDKRSGWFWKGRKSPARALRPQEIKTACRLDEIHALQMLREWVSGNKSNYHSYELNLVLKDGNRINVVDHGNQKALREDAERLSRFLGVPLWDATS